MHRTSVKDKYTVPSNSRVHVKSIDQQRCRHEDQHRSSKEDNRKKHVDESSKDQQISEQVSKRNSWLYPNLRVRMVDKRYKKGKYYNSKVSVK